MSKGTNAAFQYDKNFPRLKSILIIHPGGKYIQEVLLISIKAHSKTQLKQGYSKAALQTLSLTRYETQPL